MIKKKIFSLLLCIGVVISMAAPFAYATGETPPPLPPTEDYNGSGTEGDRGHEAGTSRNYHNVYNAGVRVSIVNKETKQLVGHSSDWLTRDCVYNLKNEVKNRGGKVKCNPNWNNNTKTDYILGRATIKDIGWAAPDQYSNHSYLHEVNEIASMNLFNGVNSAYVKNYFTKVDVIDMINACCGGILYSCSEDDWNAKNEKYKKSFDKEMGIRGGKYDIIIEPLNLIVYNNFAYIFTETEFGIWGMAEGTGEGTLDSKNGLFIRSTVAKSMYLNRRFNEIVLDDGNVYYDDKDNIGGWFGWPSAGVPDGKVSYVDMYTSYGLHRIKYKGENNYKLTIHYLYEDGGEAAPDFVKEGLKENDEYSQTSPAVEGFTPDRAVVSGKMPARDHEETVYYTADPVPTPTPNNGGGEGCASKSSSTRNTLVYVTHGTKNGTKVDLDRRNDSFSSLFNSTTSSVNVDYKSEWNEMNFNYRVSATGAVILRTPVCKEVRYACGRSKCCHSEKTDKNGNVTRKAYCHYVTDYCWKTVFDHWEYDLINMQTSTKTTSYRYAPPQVQYLAFKPLDVRNEGVMTSAETSRLDIPVGAAGYIGGSVENYLASYRITPAEDIPTLDTNIGQSYSVSLSNNQFGIPKKANGGFDIYASKPYATINASNSAGILAQAKSAGILNKNVYHSAQIHVGSAVHSNSNQSSLEIDGAEQLAGYSTTYGPGWRGGDFTFRNIKTGRYEMGADGHNSWYVDMMAGIYYDYGAEYSCTANATSGYPVFTNVRMGPGKGGWKNTNFWVNETWKNVLQPIVYCSFNSKTVGGDFG